MTKFINKFKIPTLLGLGLIFLGITSGVYLVLREQSFISRAVPDSTPKNITVTNITDDAAVISWQTNSATTSFITFGQGNPGEHSVLDDKDNSPAPDGAGLKPHFSHYVTLKNLLPKTSYQFKIISGKISSEVAKFETSTPLPNQTGFTPVIGSVQDNDSPLKNGVVYLSLPDAVIQSSEIKTGGNFLIPLSEIRKTDLSDIYQLTEGVSAKLTITSDKGEAQVIFKLRADSNTLPPIKLGQNIDLTNVIADDLDKYDLNGDGKINTADNTTVLENLGPLSPGNEASKNPQNRKTDLNQDGIVDQKDRDLMSQKLKELGVQ